MTGCRDYTHLLGAFSDGELEPSSQLDVESHVEGCEGCRERVQLDLALRQSLKQTVKQAAPEALRARMAAAMRAEVQRGSAREDQKKKGTAWRTIVPLATAAAFALAWGAMSRGPIARSTAGDSVHAGLGDDLLADLVAEHSRPLPPERTDPQGVKDLGQYVGVPVRPSNLAQRRANVHFVGGRVLPVHQERAAMLQYTVQQGGETRRVSVFIFDPRRIQVNDGDLTPQAVGTTEVRVGHSNGYSVAVTQNNGVGYALASDMDEADTVELAVESGEQ